MRDTDTILSECVALRSMGHGARLSTQASAIARIATATASDKRTLAAQVLDMLAENDLSAQDVLDVVAEVGARTSTKCAWRLGLLWAAFVVDDVCRDDTDT